MKHSGKHSVPSGRYAGHTKPICQEETDRKDFPPSSVPDDHLHLRDAGHLLLSLSQKATFKHLFWGRHTCLSPSGPTPTRLPGFLPVALGFHFVSWRVKGISVVMWWEDADIFLLRVRVASVFAAVPGQEWKDRWGGRVSSLCMMLLPKYVTRLLWHTEGGGC